MSGSANGLTVASTFTGVGGSCLGFQQAGFTTLYASEFVEAARESYALNFDTPIDPRDIREVDPLDLPEVDVLEGSPPCASFSMSGKREKAWGEEKAYSETRQRTDDLFWEFSRILRGRQPRAFVAENVPGLVIGKAKGYFKMIFRELQDCGYRVGAQTLDASWLGVPQSRNRLIFIGMRNDLGIDPVFPLPESRRMTLREGLRDLPPHEIEPETDFTGNKLTYDAWKELSRGQGSSQYLNLIRARWDRPCFTIVAQGGRSPAVKAVTHPDEPRKFTIPELKRICGFPDDFKLAGNYRQKYERLGRAVPPPMMRAIANEVRRCLEA